MSRARAADGRQPDASRRSLIAVGRCIKAFGIRGEIVVQPMTGSVERFRSLRRVFIGKGEEQAVEERVTRTSIEPRGVRIALAGVTDRTAAAALAGSFLFVEEQDRIRPRAGTYFVDDLIGMTVIDETGTTIGILREVLKMPAHDVYVVASGRGETMIPAVKEFIRRIDTASRTMHVHLIEGMVERG